MYKKLMSDRRRDKLDIDYLRKKLTETSSEEEKDKIRAQLSLLEESVDIRNKRNCGI